jgi:hypothetical protein
MHRDVRLEILDKKGPCRRPSFSHCERILFRERARFRGVTDFRKISQGGFYDEYRFLPLRLTDSVPEKYYLAAERGAKISDKSVALKFENSDILLLGAVQENLNGTMVTMYNRERMLLELIRNKTSMLRLL